MSDLPSGLDKILEMIEKRFGRVISTILLGLVVMALAAVCVHVIWSYLAQPIYGWLSELIASPITVDPNRVTAIVLTALVLIVITLTAFLVAPLLRNLARRKMAQAIIDQLAVFRSEGISILNEPPSRLGGLDKWQEKWQLWRLEVIKTLDMYLTKAESLSFQRLGVLGDTVFKGAEDATHNHKLLMLSYELSRLEKLIERYQERQ
jgi:hypothetical protein